MEENGHVQYRGLCNRGLIFEGAGPSSCLFKRYCARDYYRIILAHHMENFRRKKLEMSYVQYRGLCNRGLIFKGPGSSWYLLKRYYAREYNCIILAHYMENFRKYSLSHKPEASH